VLAETSSRVMYRGVLSHPLCELCLRSLLFSCPARDGVFVFAFLLLCIIALFGVRPIKHPGTHPHTQPRCVVLFFFSTASHLL